MPVFDDEVLMATADVDAVFAEDFVLRPYAQAPDKRAGATPDPTRDVVSLPGVWCAHPAQPKEPNAYDVREYRRPGSIGDVPHVEFSPSATLAFANFEIRSGDRIDRVSNNTAYTARTPIITPSGVIRVPLNRRDVLT